MRSTSSCGISESFRNSSSFFLFGRGHQFKRRSVVERLPGNGVDVLRDQMDIMIVQEGKGTSLGDDAPYQCVVVLHVRLLPRCLRIAILDRHGWKICRRCNSTVSVLRNGQLHCRKFILSAEAGLSKLYEQILVQEREPGHNFTEFVASCCKTYENCELR